MRVTFSIVLAGTMIGWAMFARAQTPQLGIPDAKGMGTPYDQGTTRSLIRNHGDYLDGKHRFIVDEEDGFTTIRMVKKERAPGGPHLYFDPKTGEDDSVVRFEAQKELLRIRSEVLLPAEPNYVKNPGKRYRITIEGIGVAPDYAKIFEVDAYDALDAIYAEVSKMMADTEGIERDTMFFGLMVALQWLNEDQRLPARIPLTVLRSVAGRQRIQGSTLERGEQARVRRFADVSAGQSLIRVPGPGDEALTAPATTQVRSYERGRPETVERGQTPKGHRYEQSRDDLKPADPRKQRMRGMRDPQPRKEKIGLPGRPLTVPEQPYAAVDAASMENLEILTGDVGSPLSMKDSK